MKKKYIKSLLLAVPAFMLAACTYDPYKTDIPKVEEGLSIEVSASEVDLNNVVDFDEVLFTFDWTPARQMPEDYMLTYTTELDVVGNNFGSKTVISNTEDDGVFSRSFTGTQIQNWMNDRWAIGVNKEFDLEFRVMASWTGGPTFEMPEVRKVRVHVVPVKVIIFDADKMSLAGNAIASETEIFKTLEDENVYAWVGELTPGELRIPVEYEGQSYYICPAGDGSLKDGQPDDVTMEEEAASWTITTAGKYRVVVNMADKQVTIYSPETDLQPKVVTFRPNGAEANPEVTIEVVDFWAYGGGTGWGVKKLNLTQSLADPQVFVFSGSTLQGSMKFCISNSFSDSNGVSYNQNNSYCYTNTLTSEGKRQNVNISANKLTELWGGADGETRNSYMGIPNGTNFIVFDLRNMTILATTK